MENRTRPTSQARVSNGVARCVNVKRFLTFLKKEDPPPCRPSGNELTNVSPFFVSHFFHQALFLSTPVAYPLGFSVKRGDGVAREQRGVFVGLAFGAFCVTGFGQSRPLAKHVELFCDGCRSLVISRSRVRERSSQKRKRNETQRKFAPPAFK